MKLVVAVRPSSSSSYAMRWVAQSFEAQSTDSIHEKHSYLEFVELLVDGELSARENKGLMKRIKQTLATCAFVAARENVILIGQPGTRSTRIAIGLGMREPKRGMTVRLRARLLLNSSP